MCEGREHEETSCICDPVVTGDGVHTNPDCPLYIAPDMTAYKQVVALFKALPSADSITEDTTEEERDILRAQIDEAIDALYALSDEDFAKFTAEHEALLAAAVALREAIGEAVPNLLTDSVVEILREEVSQGTYSSLAAAITAASGGDTLKILADINLGGDGVTIADKSLTLDLNDNTITHKGTYGAIKLTGNADLTVIDSGTNGDGKLEETGTGLYLCSAIYSGNTSTGTVTVSGGMVLATGDDGTTIECDGGSTSIVVTGGTVLATGAGGKALDNGGSGSIEVREGTVSATGAGGLALYSSGGGSIEVSGGMVSAANGRAIKNYLNPITISIKDGAVVTSAGNNTIEVFHKDSVLNVLGGTVENTADSGNAIYNNNATVNISDGIVSASGSSITVYNYSSGSVNLSGGTVSATDGCAIYNNYEGKIVISGNAMVTSANSKTDNTDGAGVGTIFMKKVGAGEAKVLLDIQGSSIVKNTADPAQYAVYFEDTWVTSKNLSTYYTAAETATVGKVHPEPSVATKPVPTVSGYDIYTNGVEIKIVAGNTTDSTNILYDKNGDDQIEDNEYLEITSLGTPEATGYDLSSYTIYGGSYNTNLDSDTTITMTGGKVTTIIGGGSGGTVKNASISIEGGEATYVYGGGSDANSDVTDNTSVTISGGELGDVYGGGTESNVTGNTSVLIEGGTVTSRVLGGGNNGTVNGTAAVAISNGEVGAIVGGGIGGNVNGAATVTISGGTAQSSVYGDGMINGTDTVGTGSSVTISGGAKIGNSNNPNNGIRINGGMDDISNGVDSFTIKGELTGADGSIFVNIPEGYTEGTIAQSGQANLKKIALIGGGAEGKEVYFDSTGNSIKVRQKQDSSVMLIRNGQELGGYETLNAAIEAAVSGDVIKILKDITLPTKASTPGVTIDKTITLDLNGQTVTHGGTNVGSAIELTGTASLTVTDSGGTDGNGNGKLLETGNYTKAIHHQSTGTVTVEGGTVSATGTDCNAVLSSKGKIVVSGGTVSVTNNGSIALYSSDGADIEVTGGTVSATKNAAISNNGDSTITIMGQAKVTSACTIADAGAIRMESGFNGSTLNITDGTVENTADNGNAIRNVGNSEINLSGGTVSATNGCAISNNAAGKITISGNATVTSVNTKADSGTIFLNEVPGTGELVVLDVQGTAKVENTATADSTAGQENYSVYFNTSSTTVTGSNVGKYYKKAETATVGKVHPEPPVITKPVPTVSGNDIYANGVDIRIVAGLTDGNPNSNTNILYDKNGDGQIEDDEYLQVGADAPSASGYPSINNIYGAGGNITMEGGTVQSIFGGSRSQFEGDTNITITGGRTEQVFGGGDSSNGSIKGNTNIAISGGTVTGYVYGGGFSASVDGTTTITITGGMVGMSVCGGSRNASVSGAKTVTIGASTKIGNNNTGGIVIDGGTGNITNGVTSFVIGDDLTGADGSILVSLPAGYAGGTIATEAVSSDLAKLKLVGSGAAGKEAYLDGTSIKVGQTGVDKTALAEAIAAANSAKNGITVSDNPASAVASGTKFVTTAQMKALTDAIAAAKTVMDNSLATAGEVAAAADALNNAVTTFKAAIKTGTDTGSGGGTSDGGSSGGGSSGGVSSNDSGTKTPSATTEPGTLTESEINMEGTVDASGNVTVTLPEQHVEDAIKKAEEEARKSGNPVKGLTLVLNVNTGSNTAGSVTVNLPKVTQETIISKEIANTMIVVNHPEIKIGLDLSAVQEINRQANADVNITSTRQDNNRLTGNAKAVIGSRPVFDLKVNYGSGKEVTHFGAGSVSVAIPYTLGAGEVAGGVYAVYVDGNGNVQWMDSSVYDAENRLLRFNTSHFSIYGIGYKAPAAFTDTQGHWAKDDMQFVVDRGLMNGASVTAFDPDGAVTRGMFAAALGRLAGADVSGYATSSFTDVSADAYYMGYVEWAVEKGIVGGTSATTFAPDDAVPREQMAVMMANYARAAGISLSKVYTENTFADGADISEGAREAVKTMQMAGVLADRDGNRFDPQGTATRAQAAAALHRFMEVTMDVSTAQGWRQNDDGQWMYYENGSPVKNTTRQVGGEDYSFNAFGVTLDYPKKKTRTGTYMVQAGDSFWLIAKKHNVDMYMLAAVNGKTIHSVIHPGDVLMIPQ
ncbi:MAG: S-layer homology domain-containing protein [Clostridia bacterium]|nr:S-layer homology domain-containing protein [Clostridia bacterium]